MKSLLAGALALSLSSTTMAMAQDKGEDPSMDDKTKKAISEEIDRRMKEMEGKRWSAGLNPGGGGAYLKSPDGKTYFRLYGYAQPQLTWTDGSHEQAYGHVDFRVRRARLDFSVDYDDRFKLWIEVDGAPADGTALVEAYAQAAYVRDRHYVRFGKYISPFSSENLRSSRALETVERYLALNAMFGLPGLDVQFGPMLWGTLDKAKRISYFVGTFNGNSSAGAAVASGQRGNARDNNPSKELQARLNFKVTPEVTIGGGFDNDIEDTQTLAISSYSGAAFVRATVKGKRQGFDADAHYRKDRFAFDVEWLTSDFSDSLVKLHGGYAHASYWVCGSEAKGGVQAVVRGEYAQLDGPAIDAVDGRTLTAITAGANLWWLGVARVQINGILEHTNGPGNGVITGGDRWRPTLLAQFQVKF